MHDDLFERLEHDHAPMAAVLLEIRQWFESPEAEGLPALREKLDLLKDLVIEHFGEEEESVFPAISDVLPDAAADLAGLAEAHDAICGLAVRLGVVATREQPDMGTMKALVERLEATYADHARREQATLRSIRAKLAPQVLAELRERLRGRS